MASLEEFKLRHEQYLAKAASFGYKARTNVGFLRELTSFVQELSSFKEKNKAVLDQKKRATLVLWMDYWLSFLAGSSVSKLAA